MKKSFFLVMLAFMGLGQLNAQNFSVGDTFLNAPNRGNGKFVGTDSQRINLC